MLPLSVLVQVLVSPRLTDPAHPTPHTLCLRALQGNWWDGFWVLSVLVGDVFHCCSDLVWVCVQARQKLF